MHHRVLTAKRQEAPRQTTLTHPQVLVCHEANEGQTITGTA